MPDRDPRVDAYIAKSARFARPVLEHLRQMVHDTCPEVQESIKWGCPHFLYRGAILCSMAAFKGHCAFGFRLHELVIENTEENGMGQFGKVVSVGDLPPKRALAGYIRKAMALNEAGVKRSRPKASKPPPKTPVDLAALLKQPKHAAARRVWREFTDSMRREYVEWICEAKTDATRQKRIATTLEWLAQGRQRNWQYISSS